MMSYFICASVVHSLFGWMFWYISIAACRILSSFEKIKTWIISIIFFSVSFILWKKGKMCTQKKREINVFFGFAAKFAQSCFEVVSWPTKLMMMKPMSIDRISNYFESVFQNRSTHETFYTNNLQTSHWEQEWPNNINNNSLKMSRKQIKWWTLNKSQ